MILLVDGTNQFIRYYVTFSTTTINGDPYGGVLGSLRSLENVISLTGASQVIVVFDAEGGSQRRRKVYAEYKEGRKPARLNRKFDIGSGNEKDNRKAQEQHLREYLSYLPVSTICVKGIEADDVIAYLCLQNSKERKVIVSSDQDFQQLLDPNTMIFKPTKKSFYRSTDLFSEHAIYPQNFALARALTGDNSDNIRGVPGVGLKRLVSWIPQFSGTEKITANEVFEFCKSQEHKRYKPFVEMEETLRINYKIMQLSEPSISLSSINTIKQSVRQYPSMNGTEFRLKLMRDGLDIGDKFLCTFLKLSLAGKANNV